jgi:hypothetical protein
VDNDKVPRFHEKEGKMYQHMLKVLSIIFFATDLLKRVKTGHIRIGIVGEKTNEPPLGQSFVLATIHILACVLGGNQ